MSEPSPRLVEARDMELATTQARVVDCETGVSQSAKVVKSRRATAAFLNVPVGKTTGEQYLSARSSGLLVLLLAPGVLAALIGDAAARLAGRLAGGLALAAAALDGALAEVTGLDGGDMLNGSILQEKIFFLFITYFPPQVKQSGQGLCAGSEFGHSVAE